MNYYARIANGFYLAAFWMLFALLNTISNYVKTGTYNTFWVIIASFFMLVLLPRVLTVFYLRLSKKPILTVNEDYILDHYTGMTYYWEDIREIIADGRLLYINLYNPAEYLGEINGVFYKLFAFIKYYLIKKRSIFMIDLDLLRFEKGGSTTFLDTLNKYSIASEN